jgi:hypothetical protein
VLSFDFSEPGAKGLIGGLAGFQVHPGLGN